MLIYKATNKTNGKTYVGQTTNSLKKRFDSHLRTARSNRKPTTAFHNALLKYGPDDFDVEVIEECPNSEVLNERERYWIASLNTQCPSGYNIEPGGRHFPMSEATKAKLRGRKVSDETRRLLSQVKRSPEWNKKLSESAKGRIPNENQLRGLALGRHRPKSEDEKLRFRGQDNPRALLTEDEVREIRRLYASNTSTDRWAPKEYTQDSLARMFNVRQITISTIVTRKAWKHIE